MKEILKKLINLKRDALALRDEIESHIEDGEIISGCLFPAVSNIDEVIGALVSSELSKGHITFQEMEP